MPSADTYFLGLLGGGVASLEDVVEEEQEGDYACPYYRDYSIEFENGKERERA